MAHYAQLVRASQSTVTRYHCQLMEVGYLKTTKNEGDKTYQFEVVSFKEYQELESSIDSVLDEVLKQIEGLSD